MLLLIIAIVIFFIDTTTTTTIIFVILCFLILFLFMYQNSIHYTVITVIYQFLQILHAQFVRFIPQRQRQLHWRLSHEPNRNPPTPSPHRCGRGQDGWTPPPDAPLPVPARPMMRVRGREATEVHAFAFACCRRNSMNNNFQQTIPIQYRTTTRAEKYHFRTTLHLIMLLFGSRLQRGWRLLIWNLKSRFNNSDINTVSNTNTNTNTKIPMLIPFIITIML